MPALPALPAAGAWPLFLLLLVPLGAAAGDPRPWHCAPCSADRLALCPPVPASCPELGRPAGCGCCPACALPLGAACGVATARCARGLGCRALPGEPRPLRALTRGQGACMRAAHDVVPGTEAADAKSSVAPETVPPQSTAGSPPMTPAGDLPILWNAVSNYQSLRALEVTDAKRRKAPCQRELYSALERLGREQQGARDGPYRFYLPNCSKDGLYRSKQCETSLDGEAGLCWCVYPRSGRRIPGSLEVRGDPNCHQYFH